MEGTEQRVFISYSAESRQVALRLSEYLAERGWYSSIGEEIAASLSWQDAVAEAIEGADAVVLLLGPQPSEALRFEWSLALRASWKEEGKQVVPVLLLGAEAPPFLRNLATVRLTDDVDEQGFAKVLQLIKSEGGEGPARDDADEQARLAERLDRAVDALRQDSPNKEELKEHRKALASSFVASSGPAKAVLALSIGLLDVELADHQSARAHLEIALREIETEKNPDEERLVTVLMPLGDVQAELGDWEAAIGTFERVRDIQRDRDPDSIGEAAALQELGVTLIQAERPDEARPCLSRALEISRRSLGEQHPRVSALELWLAVAAEGAGDYEAAKEVYEEALAYRERVEPEDVGDQVARLLGLGHALSQLGDLEGAGQSLRRARDLCQGGDVEPESLATILFALGDVENSRGNLPEARDFFERAIEMERDLDREVSVVPVLQLRRGSTLLEMGELQEARNALSEALTLAEEAGARADQTVVDALFVLGLVADQEGDADQAERRFRQAIDLQVQHDSSDERRLGEFRRVLDRLVENSAPAA